MTPGLNMRQTAEACGLSADRFRKVWRRWAADMAFPLPFKGGDTTWGDHYAWDEEAVAVWKKARSRAGVAPQPLPANEDAPAAARRVNPQVARQRARMLELMQEAG